MGKISSSSSKKKKRSRDLSRRKKRRRTKSKKILRRNDHSDDSEWSSTETSSYSSSEDDDYRRRKRRSKGSRKRSQRRDSSSDSEDETRSLKKKKRSKRKEEYAGKRRTRPRKRRGRDVSVSSLSSESYSTSRSENSSGESEGCTKRGRPERRGEDRGRSDKVKAKRRNRDESRSCSSSRQDVEPDDNQQVRDEVTSVKGSRRLRSVIIVVTTSNDDYRKETGHGCDGYPMSRGNEREIECYEASEEHKTMEDEKDGEAIISSPRTTADEEASKNAGEDDKMELSQDIHADDTLKGDDLESILKMRALENLRRFRGETQRNGVASKEASCAAEGESLHIESVKVEESPGHDLVEQKPDVSGGSSDLKRCQKVLQGVDNHKESGSFSHDLASPQDQLGGTATDKARGGGSSSTTRPKLIKSVWRREIANLSSCGQAAGMQDVEAQLTSRGTIDKDYPETSQTLAAKKGSENLEPEGNGTPNEQSSSCAETEVGSRGLDKPHDETKEEFEEKTMSVMRGGEMVQVSYKVYIPKKSPALARRKLKR